MEGPGIVKNLRQLWRDLFPSEAWPGTDSALHHMAGEIRMLRACLGAAQSVLEDETRPMRPRDEIQRAHNLIAGLTQDPELLERIMPAALGCRPAMLASLDALCWVLRHEHCQTFAANLKALETKLAALGVEYRRLEGAPK